MGREAAVKRRAAGEQRGSHSPAAVRTASSWRMCSMVASSARVPFVASSSTAFTVFSKEVTFVTITYGRREPGEFPHKLWAVASTCPSPVDWSQTAPSPYSTQTASTAPLQAVLHLLCVPSYPSVLTAPQLCSCAHTGRKTLFSFSRPTASAPSSHHNQHRPWQSSSAGRQQGHLQLCQQLLWWHQSGLQVPWPRPSQH